jgi:HSP20 family protein
MANITRFDPFSEMMTLRQAMDRLFEDSVVSPLNALTLRSFNGEATAPALDVHQTDDEIAVTAALPGVKAEDVDISITGQTLTIRGEFKAAENVEREQYLYRERRFGTFNRQIQLPIRVKGDAASATFEDGVLTLRIPKAEEVKPRQIQVKATPKHVDSSANGDQAT